MEAHILDMYSGVKHSFLLNGRYADCIDVNKQPFLAGRPLAAAPLTPLNQPPVTSQIMICTVHFLVPEFEEQRPAAGTGGGCVCLSRPIFLEQIKCNQDWMEVRSVCDLAANK